MKTKDYSPIKIAAAASLGLGASAAGLVMLGQQRARRNTSLLRARLCGASVAVSGEAYDPQRLESAPVPVRRYFSSVLKHGQRPITAVHLTQRGQLRLRAGPNGWRPYEATQLSTTSPPGFDWAARMQMAPGIPAFANDSYIAGRGSLRATVFGLITVAHAENTPELAQGELLRYLAEAAWFPTALLPSQRVRWEPIDDSKARVILRDGPNEASLEVRFGPDGLIESVFASHRPRDTGGRFQPTPWLGRFRSYAWREDVQIPLEGEVEWQLPEGPLVYWRGRIVDIHYELAA